MLIDSKKSQKNEKEIISNFLKDCFKRLLQAADIISEKYFQALHIIYVAFYIIGINIIKSRRKFKKYLKRKKVKLLAFFRNFFKTKIVDKKNNIIREIKYSVRRIKDEFIEIKTNFDDAVHLGSFNLLKYLFHWLKIILKYLWKAIKLVFNYLCPIAATVVLFYTINYFSNLSFGLSVKYSGTDIGYVENELVFTNAEKQMRDRIIHEEYQRPKDTVPRFTISVVDRSRFSDISEITDKIIMASGNEIIQSNGLYIDDSFFAAAADGNELLVMLDSILSPYAESVKNDKKAKIRFTSKIKVKDGLFPTTSVIKVDEIKDRLTAEVEAEKLYKVVSGDVPTTISDKLEIPYRELIALNPTIEKRLMPGDELLIKGSRPFLGVEVSKTVTSTDKIGYKTIKTSDNKQLTGYSKVTQSGEDGLRETTAEVVYVDGIEISRNEIGSRILREPVEELVTVGTAVPSSVPSTGTGKIDGGFIWPVDGGYVSKKIWGYAGHTGQDIAANFGTSIRAVASGEVKIATQIAMNGRYIVIEHGNGVQTLYAHCSSLLVKPGQRVSQGDIIAKVGSTGNSTGNHLHIEFRINGRIVDPSTYIGTKFWR